MPSIYSGVSTRMWNAALRRTTPLARLVRSYIATGPLKTTEGLFPLPIGYLVSDTGLSEDDARSALEELENEGIISWDPVQEIVLDHEALVVANYTSIRDRRVVGAVKLFRDLPETPLSDEFLKLASSLAPVLHSAILYGIPQAEGDSGDSESLAA